ASVAGGVADWFAVVALFRRPLGLPIPHTGVIPNNKERIARGLARFVEKHFLEPSTVAARLRRADLTGRFARWLGAPEHAALVADRFTQALAAVVAGIPEQDLSGFVRRAAVRGLSGVDLAGLFAIGLQAMYDSGRHQELFDGMIGRARDWIAANPGRLEQMVEDRTAWWVPKAIDRGLGKLAAQQAAALLAEMTPADSDARRAFDGLVVQLIADVRGSPRYQRRIEAIKRDMLSSEQLAEAFDRAAEEMRRLVLEDVADRDSQIRRVVADAAVRFAVRLGEDEGLRKRLERRLIWLVRGLVRPWRGSIGGFFADVMRGWETSTLADRLEAAVGRDLQYVRINGTLVGGLVGGVLFLTTYGLR
ncbi:MAG TPA: DUF445 domain-containing protein, partial [Rhodospirillales bacterium]|nr:DUF445 domain-containing protein [Rhodospirillales bacterium]